MMTDRLFPSRAMAREDLSLGFRYGATVFAVALATLVRVAFYRHGDLTMPYLPFYPAVFFVALFLGWGPGILAAGLSALGAAIWLEPVGRIFIFSPVEAIGMMLFIVESLLIVWACEGQRRAICRKNQAEEALRDTHRQATKEILERISDGFMTFDRDWRFVYVNSAAGKLLRRSPEELPGKILWDLFPESDQPLRRAMNEGVALKIEHFYPEPLNAWFEIRCYPAEDGLSVFFVDITERRATEKWLRQLSRVVQQSPASVIITDTRGNIEYINPKFTELTGYSLEEAVGKNPRILKSGEMPREVYKEIWETVTAGREWRGELLNKKKDGELFWEAASIGPITDERGAITHFLGIKENITQRKNAEMALLEAQKLAQKANEAKDHFISSLSHELRTPLTPVLLTASSLESEPSLDPEIRGQISLVRHNVEMEARMIDDLLDISKITHGKISLRPESVDLGELLCKALEIVREDISRKRIAVQVDSRVDFASAQADPVRIQQVFWNLLKNAAKFTPPGGGIQIRVFNPEPEILCVEVQDSGIGIAPEFLERIFSPFEQGPLAENHRFGGLGLGLAISKAIVELHRGAISVTSRGPGRGATFAVRLPVSRDIPVPHSLPAGAAQVTPAPPRHILLVEDDDTTRRVLSRLLTREGHKVEAVATSLAATESAKAAKFGRAEPFQVLISDLGLPDGSGLNIVRQIKAHTPGIRAVALSGYGTDDDIRESIEAGFSVHLTKPVSIEDLRRALVA